MIRVNCQFNVGGFRLFKLCYNQEMECVLSEASENAIDAPIESLKYANTAGVKFIYQHLQSGGYVVVLTNIASIYKDDSGRPTKSAVIFSGDESDRDVMDNIALDILNNQPKFEEFFAGLFSFYKGFNIRYDGDKLAEYIRGMERQKQYEGKSAFSKIQSKKAEIICFVPVYPNWNVETQEKIIRELKLSAASLKKAIVLTQDQWEAEQGALIISDILIEEPKVEQEKELEKKNDIESEDNKVQKENVPKEPSKPELKVDKKPTQEHKRRTRTCLIACLAVLLAYLSAWRWLIFRDKEKDPELMKAFFFSQIIILLLIIVLICS